MNINDNIIESELFKKVERDSKLDYCLLCGKKMNSFCNSHVVPKFVLKYMTDNGMISYGQALNGKTSEIHSLKTTKGLNNAFTFKLICEKCDKEKFADYEQPEAILQFSELDFSKKNKILTQMAVKTHLSHFSTKLKMFHLNSIVYRKEIEILRKQKRLTAYEIDLWEHCDYLYRLSKNHKKTNFPFLILYDKLLDYSVDLATQTIISYIYDLQGNQNYNPKDLSTSIITRYFYLMVLPYNNKTRILFYIEKNNKQYVKNIIEQFEKLSEEDKLHFLFISLIIYNEQFFMRPSFKDSLLKDKKLIRLYQGTDSAVDYTKCSEIKNFKNCKNYLLKN